MTCSGYNARYDWLNSIRTSFSQGSVKEKTKQTSLRFLISSRCYGKGKQRINKSAKEKDIE